LLSPALLTVLNENKRLNPDIDFQLWDDDDIDKFILNEFPSEYYKAFKSINIFFVPDKQDYMNCYIQLSPIPKQSFTIETEGTNTGNGN
jgi:hypothetical protein